MTTTGLLFIAAYLALYGAWVAGLWWWRPNRRQERPPTPTRLLRSPGESLRQKLESFDNLLLTNLLTTGILPLLLMALGVWGVSQLDPTWAGGALALLLLAVGAGLLWGGRQLLQLLELRRNHYLGYYGERVVGERLEELRAEGYRVFHDVPAPEAPRPFNLDHVVVGPTGLFAIETKTRRKGPLRPGLAEHKIIARDGELEFPWGADRHGLASTAERAAWLGEWVYQVLGYRLPVTAVLTFPGWWVEEQTPGPVRVTNPEQLLALVRRAPPALGADEIERVARQLEARCRDVEF